MTLYKWVNDLIISGNDPPFKRVMETPGSGFPLLADGVPGSFFGLGYAAGRRAALRCVEAPHLQGGARSALAEPLVRGGEKASRE